MSEKTEIIEKDESVNKWILYVMTKIVQKITDEQEQEHESK